jgi:exopolysaccharide biosynthesis polyprenyl glycosylphosphotransferase
MTPSDANPLVATAALAPRIAPEPVETAHLGYAQAAARRTTRAWAVMCLAVDAAMLLTATAASELGSTVAHVGTTPQLWLGAFPLLVLALLSVRGTYAPRLRLQFLDDFRAILVATTVAAMAVITARALLGDESGYAAQTFRVWSFALVYVAAGRAALHWSQAQARRHGEAGVPTLIIGAGRVGRLTAKRLLDEPELGLRPVGFIDKEPLDADDGLPRLPVLGASWDLEQAISEHEVRHVIIAFSTAPDDVLLGIVKRCQEQGVAVSFVPRLFEKVTRDVDVNHLGGLPLLTVHPSNPRGWQFAVKYAVDRAVGALLMLIASPVLLASALAVLVTTGRPVLYRQPRVGLDGREFGMLKLRSMDGTPQDDGEADADWAALQSGANVLVHPSAVKDRTTPVGRVLRKLSLDELPQLWNVVRGDMSLVGPRPERASYVHQFEYSVYRYGERHRVKSGITGWAQVHGLRGKTSLADRVEWDNYYIENWSLWLDVKIVLMTFVAVFRFRDA